MLVIAHPSDPKWEATVNGGSPLLEPAEIDAIEAFVRDGGGLIVLGETEEDKYGANLNELLGRFDLAIDNATAPGLRPPPRRRAVLGPRAALDHGRRPGRTPTSLAGVEAACFYRAGALSAANGARVIARAHQSASIPGAPLAAVADARRRPRRRHRRLRPLRRRLHRRARPRAAVAQPRPLGRAARVRRRARAAPRSPATADPAWTRLQRRRRGAPPHPGRRRLGRHRRARPGQAPQPGRDDRRVRAGAEAPLPAPARLHRRARRRPARLGRRRLRATRLRPLDGGLPARARPPRRDRAPVRVPDVQAERLARHLLRGARRPRSVAGLDRPSSSAPATTTPSSSRSPWSTTPAATTPSAPSSSPRPSQPASGPPSTTSAPSSATARPSASAASAAPRPRPCGSTCRPDAACLLSSRELSESAYMLWDLIHDRTHMRGDLPFDPFMIRQRSPYWMYSLEELRCDLTAFGEAVRARSARASRSRATPSTRSSSTASSASRSPARGCATTTGSAASCCSPSCTARATCTGPTTG